MSYKNYLIDVICDFQLVCFLDITKSKFSYIKKYLFVIYSLKTYFNLIVRYKSCQNKENDPKLAFEEFHNLTLDYMKN